MTVDISDVVDARERIRDVVRATPLWPATVTTSNGPIDVLFKMEQLQISGTFKARGMFNAVLRLRDSGQLGRAGLAIASGGNAGIAAAIAARHVGAPVTVFVPTGSPAAKVDRLTALGADVVEAGATHSQTHPAAAQFSEATGAHLLHPYDLRDVVAGAGTLALEIDEQNPNHGPVLVAVGGGGLVAGVASVGRARGYRTIAVEPTGAATLHAALHAGRPTRVEVDTIAADSLGAAVIGNIAFQVCSAAPVDSVLVADNEITRSREYLWNEYRLLVENAAAVPLAALQARSWTPADDDSPPVVVLCGANVARKGTSA